jgi:hypothetical protein
VTASGTNLLGLVKHSTATHFGYFGEVFGRSSAEVGERFVGDAGPAAEFWATAHESRQEIVNRYRSAWDFADAALDDAQPKSSVTWPAFSDASTDRVPRAHLGGLAELGGPFRAVQEALPRSGRQRRRVR